MPIRYHITENPLVMEGPERWIARPRSTARVDLEELVRRMSQRGTTVTEPDVRAVVNLLFDEIERAVLEGCNVNLPHIAFRPVIAGTFRGREDQFQKERHELRVATVVGPAFRKAMATKAKAEKVRGHLPRPILDDLKDGRSGITNQVVTPGSFATLRGSCLKLNPERESDGVFFVREFPRGPITPSLPNVIRATMIIDCTDSKISFEVPRALAAYAGHTAASLQADQNHEADAPVQFRVQVRRSFSKSAGAEEEGSGSSVRTGQLDSLLTLEV